LAVRAPSTAVDDGVVSMLLGAAIDELETVATVCGLVAAVVVRASLG